MVEQKLPTLQQIKKAIPERCFHVRTEEWMTMTRPPADAERERCTPAMQ